MRRWPRRSSNALAGKSNAGLSKSDCIGKAASAEAGETGLQLDIVSALCRFFLILFGSLVRVMIINARLHVYGMSKHVLNLHRPPPRIGVAFCLLRRNILLHTEVESEKDSPESKAAKKALRAPRTILLVDDAQQTRFITKLFLANFGFIVHSFSSAEDALAHFDCRVHDLVVTDNTMPGMTGEEMAHVVKMRSHSTPVVMYSGRRPADCSCLDHFIEKPASLSALKDAVDRLLARPN
jgi:CheY-like chemotaxis protein